MDDLAVSAPYFTQLVGAATKRLPQPVSEEDAGDIRCGLWMLLLAALAGRRSSDYCKPCTMTRTCGYGRTAKEPKEKEARSERATSLSDEPGLGSVRKDAEERNLTPPRFLPKTRRSSAESSRAKNSRGIYNSAFFGQAEPTLARPLVELLDHLSSIRNLALALAPPISEGVQVPAEVASAPVSPTRASLSGTAARHVLPVGREERPESSSPEAERRAEPRTEGSPVEVAERRAEPRTSPVEVAEPQMADLQIEAAIATAVYVSQIVQGLDAASQQACGLVTGLETKLHEISRDRELWVHRYLAIQELQYAEKLCKQAMGDSPLAAAVLESPMAAA
ncbi:unnamed protein product [Effrenium voratum]|uniref:Uncharacterized protein n=1 Tax=Effrenium voratum TaxID=2562239 RepID=A0AA36N5V8_9DINO|nr:unnamed protein product [Effrenium voratum]